MMKRVILCFFCFAILFCGACGQIKTTDRTPAELSAAMAASLDETVTVTALDDEAVRLEFGDLPGVTQASVYTVETASGTGEIGVFAVEHASRGSAQEALRAHLEEKAEAAETTAALYPSEKSAYAARAFRGAKAETFGDLLYYIALDDGCAETCAAALKSAAKN